MFAKWKKNIFLHFILSYFVILAVLMAVVLAVSIQNLMQRQRTDLSLSEQAVEQSIANIENRFTEFSNLVQNISVSENLREIQREQSSSFYASYKLVQDLQNQCYLNSFVDAIYVMLPEEDTVIGSDGIVTNTKFFYRIRYGSSDGAYEEWLEGMQNAREYSGRVRLEQVRIGSDETKVIMYSQPLVATAANPMGKGQVFIYISEERLRSLIVNSREIISFGMSVSPMGESIQLIDSPGEPEGKTFPVFRSSNSGTEYSSVLSESAILKGWYEQFLLTFTFIALASLVAALLCIYFARRSSRPIHHMVNILSETPEKKFTGEVGIYDYMQGRLTELLSDRHQLSLELERRLPLMQVGFIERLLSGTVTDYTDLEEQLGDIRIHLEGSCYCVAVLQIINFGEMENDPEELSAVQMSFEKLIYHEVGENAVVYANDGSRITVIFAMQSPEEETRFAEICRGIMEQMQKQGIRVQSAVSAPYDFLADTFIAFAQAKKLLSHISAGEDCVLLRYNGYQADTTFYFYPTEVEIKLIRIMTSGNQAAVEAVFHELREKNTENRRLSPAMMHSLVEELNGTYLKIISSLNDAGIHAEDLDRFYLEYGGDEESDGLAQAKKRFCILCEFVGRLREEKSGKLKERIQEYLEQHFTDANMNLSMLSEEFGVTEVHMSRMFKEQMATTFSQYLEKRRMNYALELLKDSEKSIGRVAEECGYSSSHAFRRAFKRFYGYLPSGERSKEEF